MDEKKRRKRVIHQSDLERRIIKDETVVTCDNEKCEYRGEMLWCYLSQEKRCGIYLDYANGSR